MTLSICEVKVFEAKGFLKSKSDYTLKRCKELCIATPGCTKFLMGVGPLLKRRCEIYSNAATCMQPKKRWSSWGPSYGGIGCGRYVGKYKEVDVVRHKVVPA